MYLTKKDYSLLQEHLSQTDIHQIHFIGQETCDGKEESMNGQILTGQRATVKPQTIYPFPGAE